MKIWIGTVVLYLQFYHCHLPISIQFAEADILKHTSLLLGENVLLSNPSRQLFSVSNITCYKTTLYSLWKDKYNILHVEDKFNMLHELFHNKLYLETEHITYDYCFTLHTLKTPK